MKNFIFSGIFFLAFQMLHAQSNIIVFSQEGESFWLILNGARQNEAAETNVKITGLSHPNYKMKVIFENESLGEIDKNLFLPEYAAEVSYNITTNRKGEKVVRYVSDVPIAQAPAASSNQTVRTYTATARPVVRKQVTVTEHRTGMPAGENVNVTVSTPMGGMSINVNEGNYHSTSSTTTTTTTYTETYTGEVAEPAYVLPGYSGPIGCPAPMAPADFQSAKNSIASKDWDETRLTIAKQIVGSNCLLSAQVRELVDIFGWEASKLDFAKFAYGRTYDLGNYFKINDAFEWESSSTELNNYINSQR